MHSPQSEMESQLPAIIKDPKQMAKTALETKIMTRKWWSTHEAQGAY